METQWRDSLDGLETWLQMVQTHPLITRCILRHLRRRLLRQDLTPLPSEAWITPAIMQQNQIGWVNFLEGKIALEWQALQERHYLSLHSRRSGRSWASGLVTNLLEMCHSQWITRNRHYVHQYADNGLPLEEAAALVADIQEEFRLGTTSLHPDDHHFLATNAADVLSRTVSYQLAWRRGIQNARRTQERRTASSLARMQATMRLWLDHPG